jgi:uncharacterized membrane protein
MIFKMDLPKTTLLITTFLSGLMAGLMYSFFCAVKPGLGSLIDKEYIRAMQAINAAIQNPLFFTCFLGTSLMLPVCCYFDYQQSGLSVKSLMLIASTLLYLIGVAGVTMVGNVPLNDYLAGNDIANRPPEELQLIRQKFEIPWNTLHSIRTTASIFSFSLLIIRCLLKE